MNYQNLFNTDFFPTPEPVIEQMLMDEDISNAVVLEPSAGSGNIVRFCKNQGAREILACEINDTLRSSLFAIEGCEVIGSDFFDLTSEQVIGVNYIVMNPPFSNIEKHILHAWEIAPPGCTIITLCPSSRFNWEKQYTENIEIRETINLYGFSHDLGKVFSDSSAERKTNAEITLIKLYKPAESMSDFLDMDFDSTPECYSDLGTGKEGLIKYDVLRDMVQRYYMALEQFDSVQEASNKINDDISFFSNCRITFGAHGKDHNDYDLHNITKQRFRKELQHSAWKKVFDLLNMEKYTTSVLQKKIAFFIECSQARPFTLKRIYMVVNAIIQNINNLMNECIVQAFDMICSLSAENTSAGEHWKTNSNYMVNQKFIVDYFETRIWDHHLYCSSSYSLQKMEDLYKALSFVAGKPIDSKIYNPFERNIIEKCRDFGTWYQFDWFRVKFYKKGTMHFQFTDINVWYRFNQIAAEAKGWKIGSQTNTRKQMWKDVG